MLDTLLGEKLYLYSWQERDTSKIEFTILKDDGELGLKFFFLSLTKKTNLFHGDKLEEKVENLVIFLRLKQCLKTRIQ